MDSGHHRATLAIEKAFHLMRADIDTLNVNSFNYTNPILEKIINRTYMGVIRQKPEFWGYLYDNPKIIKNVKKLRESIHKHNASRLKQLIESFDPDAVICTQAFPCGMVADYKANANRNLALFGVLTDYAPHSYWIFDKVDGYFVPSKETGDRLIHNGVLFDKVIESGIPVDPHFKIPKDKSLVLKKLNLSVEKPIILMMGGSQGHGPLKEAYQSLIKTKTDFQILVITGKNKSALRWFKRRERNSCKKLIALPFVNNTDELMEIATILISKPGGITTAEAFVKGVPLCIINPIPGHESMNADHLLRNNVAIKIEQPSDTGIIIEELFYNRDKLTELSLNAKRFSKPDSAEIIARHVLNHIK